MEVFVENTSTGKFSIQVNTCDTVLTMKQKIEKIQGISVSKQTLYLDSKVLHDNIDIEECKIFNNSRLLLAISTDQNNNPVMVNDQVLPQTETPLVTAESLEELLMNDSPETMEGKDHQLLHQTEQSFAEAIYTQLSRDIGKIQSKETIQDQTDPTKQSTSNTTEEIKDDHQDSTKTYQKDQYSSSKSGINIQDSPVKVTSHSKKRKTLQIYVRPFQETRKYPVLVHSDDKFGALRKILANKNQLGVFALPEGEYFFINKQHLLTDDQTFEENGVASFDTLEILGTKFPVRGNRSNKNVSLRLNSSQQLRATQDLPPVSAGNKGIKTKQSPNPVSVKRGIISTPDSPERKRRKRIEFTVMVQPFKEETRKIAVNVNSDEKVEELRAKLAKLKEKNKFDLPEEGYFFIHRQHVLADHHTFEENLVAHGDTIEIFCGSVSQRD